MSMSVSRGVIDAAIYYTRETLLSCMCTKASLGVMDQISDASQDYLEEVRMSIESVPLKSRCDDCSKLGLYWRLLRISRP
jgi:hypothetical protein